jgi:glycosyltransferase involved in cell wall biosynthesis
MSLRVLHVLTTPNRRGAESGAVALNQALQQRGVHGEIVSLSQGSGGPTLDVEVLGGHSLSPSTLLKFRARSRNADVVVAHGSRTLPASAIALAGRQVPFVYKNIGETAYWSASPLRRMRVRAALRRSAAVIALTSTAKKSLHIRHGLPDEQVVVIPSWRSGGRFVPVTGARRHAARAALGLPDGVVVYLILGALASEKRVDLAIAAVAPIAGAYLLVVGDGPERARLEVAAEATIPGRCVFAGAVDEPEALLPAANAVLLTSESEGVPGVLIEAGLSCLPTVAYDVGGVSSVVLHEETGLLVPPGDVDAMTAACRRVVEHADAMGERARRRCLELYDTDRVVGMWLALLQSVIDVAQPRTPGGVRQ